jgi:hypothetical protein
LVPLILDHNVRNTRQIANAFQPLVDHPMRFLGGDGPAVKFVACSRDDAMNVGDDEVELLLEEGRRPDDVALLTTKEEAVAQHRFWHHCGDGCVFGAGSK